MRPRSVACRWSSGANRPLRCSKQWPTSTRVPRGPSPTRSPSSDGQATGASLLTDPNIDVIDITTPNDLHPEIAVAAAKAGKHIYCEKPLANSAAEARRMTEAAEAAGVVTLVGFNYLKNPAQALRAS